MTVLSPPEAPPAELTVWQTKRGRLAAGAIALLALIAVATWLTTTLSLLT